MFDYVATGGVYHRNRNGTYIQIFNRANPSTSAWQADFSYSEQTVLCHVRDANCTPDTDYYIFFGSGAASSNIFCAPESKPMTGIILVSFSNATSIKSLFVYMLDSPYCTFNIWDPGVSSTTTKQQQLEL